VTVQTSNGAAVWTVACSRATPANALAKQIAGCGGSPGGGVDDAERERPGDRLLRTVAFTSSA
jgi:hypothetical protein